MTAADPAEADVAPTGRQLSLDAAGYHADVTEIGGHLRRLTWNGRPLVREFDADRIPPLYSGAVLAPWPNRIADGRYTFHGNQFQLPINEVDRGTALHGLVADRPWSIAEVAEHSVLLRHRVWPTQGYPFLLDLELRYSLDDRGLTFELVARNSGTTDTPYGCSIHPYLVAGPGTVDDWTLRLPAGNFLSVDADRLLPRELLPVQEFDFRAGRSLDGLVVDHAFSGLTWDGSGHCALDIVDKDGSGTRMSWGRATPWVQICTADRPEPGLHRTGLAAEPMTCPPDAFNSGIDLVTLGAGRDHATRIRIAGIDSADSGTENGLPAAQRTRA